MLLDAFGNLQGSEPLAAEVLSYINRIRDRWWLVWRCEQLLAPAGACGCHLLPDLATWQVIRKTYRDHVQATDDFYELCLEIEAGVRDWETLRGSAARRKQLEVRIGVRKRQQGRPRRVYLTEEDRETAKRILDHVRSTGSDHPGRIWSDGFVARMMPGIDSLRDSWCPWPADASPQVQVAADVVIETCALSEAQYRRRRSAMASRLLAAIGDCSFEAVRPGSLPETLDSADGDMDNARLQHAAEVLQRVQRRRTEGGDPGHLGEIPAERIVRVAAEKEETAEQIRARFERGASFAPYVYRFR